MFGVWRRGRRCQWVTTTSALAACSQWAARAKGASRFTATGLPVSARAEASSSHRRWGGSSPIVPSPPASETAAASSWPARPPPMPAWTTGTATPMRSSRSGTACEISTVSMVTTTEQTPTIFEWGGGREAFARWLNAFYDMVEGEELLAPIFGGVVSEEHREHVTDWWCEVMGGPAL